MCDFDGFCEYVRCNEEHIDLHDALMSQGLGYNVDNFIDDHDEYSRVCCRQEMQEQVDKLLFDNFLRKKGLSYGQFFA